MNNPAMSTVEMLAKALDVPKEKLLGISKKNSEADSPLAQSRLLQQAWPLAAELPLKGLQYLAKMIRPLPAQNGGGKK